MLVTSLCALFPDDSVDVLRLWTFNLKLLGALMSMLRIMKLGIPTTLFDIGYSCFVAVSRTESSLS